MMHVGQRHCARCGQELTDAASMEAGIGPVCRKLDNALLARQIPSDIPMARAAYEAVDLGSLPPETVPTFIKVEADLLNEKAEVQLDWRETVKRIEWLRSFSIPYPSMNSLLNIAAALGYVGLVSLWKGEAATGKSFVWATEGRIYVSGPRNKSARLALRKIQGWKFHGYSPVTKPDGEQVKAWSFPADKWEQVQKTVWAHYPNNEGLKAAVDYAQGWLAQKAEEAAASKPATPVGESPVALGPDGWLRLKSPHYKATFVAAIKELPSKSRKWLGDEKAWSVAPEYAEKAVGIFKAEWPSIDVPAAVYAMPVHP